MSKFFIFTLLAALVFLAPGATKAEKPASSSAAARLEQLKQERRETVKEQVQTRKENLTQIREQFKTQLQEIKDSRKQNILDNLDKAYVNINQRWTTHFKNVLERLVTIADKLKTLAEQQNNTQALTALDDVYNQIDAANIAVDNQATRVYTLDLSDQSKIRDSVQVVHTQLHADLATLQDQIKSIRDSLITILHLLRPVTTGSATSAPVSPTLSPSITPTESPAATPTIMITPTVTLEITPTATP